MSSSEKDYGDEPLAARLLQMRQELGLSMEAFAALLGVSQPTQSRIERAKRLPDALYLRRLRGHFGTDINALLDQTQAEAMQPPQQTVSIKVSSRHGHAAGRDVNVNTEGAANGKQGNLKPRGARGRA